MEQSRLCLTICFEGPFWVGLFERWSGGRLEVCKLTFGGEPRDGEVWAFVLTHWRDLASAPPVAAVRTGQRGTHKQAQRQATAQLERRGAVSGAPGTGRGGSGGEAPAPPGKKEKHRGH